MSRSGPIEGVFLSPIVDLATRYSETFSAFADRVRIRLPDEIEDPSVVRFAVAWGPEPDAFARYPNLLVVSSIAAGVDALLANPSLPKNAYVTRLFDDDQADMMAGFAAWHVIWHHRNMANFLAQQEQHIWKRMGYRTIIPPCEYPVGVLGYGLMGKAVAKAVSAMGFPVIAAVRHPRADEAEGAISFESGPEAVSKVAARSRSLINVLPLTNETRGVLNYDLFSAMPKGAVLVQLGRGDQLVEKDLQRALDEGHLAGASLDVFETEPMPKDHPWWSDPRILVTPHVASEGAPRTLARQVCAAVEAAVAGERPVTAVSREKGY